VQKEWFGKVIGGAMVDHCHKTNPRIATPEDYMDLLAASM
jgi:4-hydroxybutyrate dehydrogenase